MSSILDDEGVITSSTLFDFYVGGKDLSAEIPGLGQSALYCVTEIHTSEDIARLAAGVEKAVT